VFVLPAFLFSGKEVKWGQHRLTNSNKQNENGTEMEAKGTKTRGKLTKTNKITNRTQMNE
jgi:hypothetical protein